MPLEDHAPCMAPIVDVKSAKRPIRPCGCAVRRSGDYCERHAKHKAGFDALRSMLKPGWEREKERERDRGASASSVSSAAAETPTPQAPRPTPQAPTLAPQAKRPTVVVDFRSFGQRK